MKTILSFFKSLLVGNMVGLLLGSVVGVLLSFPYYTALMMIFAAVQLPGLVTMVVTGTIPQHSDYTLWPHWVPMFHLLAVGLYYGAALLGYGYCGFHGTRRTRSGRAGFMCALWASVVATAVSMVSFTLATMLQSGSGTAYWGPIVGDSIALSLVMGMVSCLLAALSGSIGASLGSKHGRVARTS